MGFISWIKNKLAERKRIKEERLRAIKKREREILEANMYSRRSGINTYHKPLSESAKGRSAYIGDDGPNYSDPGSSYTPYSYPTTDYGDGGHSHSSSSHFGGFGGGDSGGAGASGSWDSGGSDSGGGDSSSGSDGGGD